MLCGYSVLVITWLSLDLEDISVFVQKCVHLVHVPLVERWDFTKTILVLCVLILIPSFVDNLTQHQVRWRGEIDKLYMVLLLLNVLVMKL